MPIPSFRPDNWLPEGHHSATWEEIEAVFGGEPASTRREVLTRLLEWRDAARAKERPGDFDLLFLYDTASEAIIQQDTEALALIDPIRCKAAFRGDVFACSAKTAEAYPQFFATDTFDSIKFSDVKKGVVEVNL